MILSTGKNNLLSSLRTLSLRFSNHRTSAHAPKHFPHYLLILLGLVFSVSACQHSKKDNAQQSSPPQEPITYKAPNNLAEAHSSRPRVDPLKKTPIYYIVPAQSTIQWQAARPGGRSFYKGIIKIRKGSMLQLNKEGHIRVAIIAMPMAGLKITNVSDKARPTLEAQIKGLVKGQNGWGFAVNYHPYGVIDVAKVSRENGHLIFTLNISLKGENRSIEVAGSFSKVNANTVKIHFDPFSIDLDKWYVLFDNKRLMSHYIQFQMDFTFRLKTRKS